MIHLTLTLEEEINTLNKYGLTANELLVIRVLLLFQNEQQKELLHNLITTLKRINLSLRDILIQLQNKEIILKSWKVPCEGCSFNPEEIPINKNFIKNIYKCSFEIGKELFDTYPQFTQINNCVVPLRTVAKHFDSLEQAYFKYGKAIRFNIEKHNEIVSLVSWAKENDILKCSLSSFIINEGWNDLNTLKNDGGVANVNYDAIKMI